MAKKDIPTSEAQTHADVVDALREIGEQLKGIGQVLEEIRTDFQWAAQNCRIDPEEAKRSKPVASDDVQPPVQVNGDTSFRVCNTPRFRRPWLEFATAEERRSQSALGIEFVTQMANRVSSPDFHGFT